MGAMKNYLMDLGFAIHENDLVAIHKELQDGDPQTFAWTLGQMSALRTMFDGETGMFLGDPEPELSDGFFIGGEGIDETEHAFCFDCWVHYMPSLALVRDPEMAWMRMTTTIRDDVWLWRYDPYESAPVTEIPRCNCGNWIWVKTGHDVLLDEVASGRMSPEIATAFINRSYSFEIDTRAFNRDEIDVTLANWDTRWQG